MAPTSGAGGGDDTGGRIELSGRAIVANTSGTDFANATIGLIAGEVRRVSPPSQPKMRAGMRGGMMPMAADAPRRRRRQSRSAISTSTPCPRPPLWPTARPASSP